MPRILQSINNKCSEVNIIISDILIQKIVSEILDTVAQSKTKNH